MTDWNGKRMNANGGRPIPRDVDASGGDMQFFRLFDNSSRVSRDRRGWRRGMSTDDSDSDSGDEVSRCDDCGTFGIVPLKSGSGRLASCGEVRSR